MIILLILLQLYTPKTRISVYYDDDFGARKAIPLFIATEAVKHIDEIIEQDTVIVAYDTIAINNVDFISVQGDTISYNWVSPENLKRIVIKLKTQ